MGPKRASPLDDPPTASSSDSEEDSEALSQDEQPSTQQHQQKNQEDASSEELEDDDEEEEAEDDDDAPPPSSAIKRQPFVTNSLSQPSSSESATESNSDSDSDLPSSTVAANPKVKPLSSKLMEETPKPKPQPSATSAKSVSKRRSENNGHLIDPKRAKKNVTDASDDDDDEDGIPFAAAKDGKKNGDDSKKQFQRLWSEEDEIVILKGMVAFSSKIRMDPNKDANAFYNFVKKSLHADATRNQLKQKIRRLKKKFEVNSGKEKNGEGPSFIKIHDQKAFELSKKVWAKGGGVGAANGVVERLEKTKTNGKARNNSQKGDKKNAASPKPKAETLPLNSTEPEKIVDIDEKHDATLHLSEMIRFDKGMGQSGQSGLNEDVVKMGLELIGASKRTELEQRWKKLLVTELELYGRRAELIQDQAKLILEAYKASNH